jgi:translation initiation factor IF-3
MLGVLATREAIRLAEEQGLDLVEVSPNADPPVCRIMAFGKFRYDEGRREKMARKHQHSHQVKEIKFHPNVAEHDYTTKVGHIRGFLGKGLKVKVSLTFRGRENAHRDLGFGLMSRVIKDCSDLSAVDMEPRTFGRSIVAVIGPRAPKTGGGSRPAQTSAPAAPSVPRTPPVARPPASPAPATPVAPAVPPPPVASATPAETTPAP